MLSKQTAHLRVKVQAELVFGSWGVLCHCQQLEPQSETDPGELETNQAWCMGGCVRTLTEQEGGKDDEEEFSLEEEEGIYK